MITGVQLTEGLLPTKFWRVKTSISDNIRLRSQISRELATAANRQRMSVFLHRGVHARLHGADDPGVTQIVDDADDKLFRDIYIKPTSYTTPLIARTDHTNASRHDIDSYVTL